MLSLLRPTVLTQDYIIQKKREKNKTNFLWQFFGRSVAVAMEAYKKEGVVGLQDCEPTINFIRRIHDVAEAMNSQIPVVALRVDQKSQHNKVSSFCDMKFINVMINYFLENVFFSESSEV